MPPAGTMIIRAYYAITQPAVTERDENRGLRVSLVA